ncbi:hypothetical protein [Entomospira culicis]|uniref:Uncharacterized protein n=1 Tax=Entomospira culicis TaxID=2719989 RepID=A0A968GKC0_9SPIO|nr:hypothetical protein [Entomospira culicis]NIZ19216.1 hypothetical protein [Entomospira culicis]NIZ69430.1 hypothetical protein [Entomospira culicis]WDI36546.1 hypothetical protein PVA46_04285 [Entomospira culicis]WDI38172.1 hypothetical protein PVA47_04285 [Entomospira culicis]
MGKLKKFWYAVVLVAFVGGLGLWLYGDKTVESQHIDTSLMSDEVLRASLMPEGDYVVYFLWGTMPNIYAGMHMQLHDKPSILWAVRPENFNFDYLPAHVIWIDDPHISDIPHAKSKDFIPVLKANHGAFEQAIDRILAENPDAVFHVYMADYVAYWAMNYYFISKGVSTERLHVDFISEGSFTLNEYFNKYVWVYPGDSKIKDMLKWIQRKFLLKATFQDDKRKAQAAMKQAQKDITKVTNHGPHYLFATTLLYDNARHWLFHDAEIFPIPYVANQQHFFPLPMFRFYNLLDMEEQKQFEQLMNFNKAEFDSVLYPEGETKKPLIIIGSWDSRNPDKENKRISADFEQEMRELVEIFGADHRIFFKGHPALPYGNEAEEALMQELNFEQLPNVNFPFELLVMSYPDLVVGGYQSSVFISVPPAQLQFILGELWMHPMKYFYEHNYWSNAIHINP